MGRVLFIISAFFLLCSCKDRLKGEEETTSEKIVAMAGDETLNLDEFRTGFVSTGIIKDSLYNAKKSIEKWATEALFYQEAKEQLEQEELDIEKQVDLYRQSLISYVYQTKLIEANLDTTISRDEIESYYNEHRDNFILKENIVKVNYFKIPVQASALTKIKKLVNSVSDKDKMQLRELCEQNAENFFMNDSIWLFLEDIKKEIPALRDQPDFNLSPGRVLEFSDQDYYYYLKVKDVKIKNGLSPINFEIQNIKKLIINIRKSQLITEYKKNLIEKAKTDKKFVIY
jgi:hypothetical protein